MKKHIELPTTTVPREYDALRPPGSEETHKYIASSRLIQKTALVKALLDPDCGRSSFVERDFEYLRVTKLKYFGIFTRECMLFCLIRFDSNPISVSLTMLLKAMTPDAAHGQDATSSVEADLILDEHTAILFHPLGDLGQATGFDVEGGLKTLVATLARIGPRYKNLWLIFEEYYSPAHLVITSSTTITSGIRTAVGQRVSSAPLPILARPNPYSGPTMKHLGQFMAWVPSTRTRTHWLSRIHRQLGYQQSHQTTKGGDVRQQQQQPFGIQDPGQAMDDITFETQVLFASEEHCAARMVRAIGEGIVGRIDRAARDEIRRDEDGWQDAEEWLWRDWLNDQDSTVSSGPGCELCFCGDIFTYMKWITSSLHILRVEK